MGAGDLQVDMVTHPGGGATVVSPPGGALVADSAQIPGGLLGLMSTGARTERSPAGHP
ncbi:hypothetical protein ACWD6R_27475 [Streptomyces sp. NPDC005151]